MRDVRMWYFGRAMGMQRVPNVSRMCRRAEGLRAELEGDVLHSTHLHTYCAVTQLGRRL